MEGLTKGIIPFDLSKLFPNDDDAVNLLQGMLNYNPYHRPTAEECLNHPYFKDFKEIYQRPEVKQIPEINRSLVDSEYVDYSLENQKDLEDFLKEANE